MTSPMGYLGGKSAYLGKGSGPWIASKLPYTPGYLEPFAGMLGVLLQRRPVDAETVNDINSRISNWWQVVRDSPEELKQKLHDTAVARDDYLYAIENVDSHPDPVERARMITVLILCNVPHSANPSPSQFVIGYTSSGPKSRFKTDKILELADRLRNVQIENIDACRLLEKTVPKDELTIYCDPPYEGTTEYSDHTLDRDRFMELLLAQKGKVAVSGYGEEYDLLCENGWHKEVRQSRVSIGNYMKSDAHKTEVEEWDNQRMEALWMNYTPPPETLF